jgi:2-oxoglutarate dehydrogenase E2 component (dihydrolipoamide succinyltransferase)
MALELKVPPAGESITEVQIGQWLKKEGDTVRRDEILVVIETDKVTVELPAPASGKLTKILVGAGKDAQVGDIIGYLEEGAVDAAPASASKKPAPEAKPAAEAKPLPAPKPASASKAAPAPAKAVKAESEEEEPSRDVRASLPPQAFARVMPAARRAMAEQNVSASEVTPTGPGGRVLKEDVERAAQAREARPEPAPVVSMDTRGEEIVPMSPMRRKIAERLVESQQTMALLTTFNEVDMSQVMNLRKLYQDQFVKKYGIKLGFMSFFVKAAVEALKEFPAVNAEIRERSIVYKNYYDIGVAVGGGKGLVVPVIRNADRLSFAQIEQTITELGQRAQKNQIKLEELMGGTFTISNGGVYGSMLSTPIVNPPQSGVLGMHNIIERPWAVDGKVEIRPIMYVALTYDHRIVDGREAVSFLKRIKDTIESPSRILLEV